MKKIGLLILISISLCGCSSVSNKINKEYIKNLTKNQEYVILDVRTASEYNQLHVKDSINLPVDNIKEINIEKDKIIFVYCKSGNRSSLAYNTLVDLGYTVYDLGGIDNIILDKE